MREPQPAKGSETAGPSDQEAPTGPDAGEHGETATAGTEAQQTRSIWANAGRSAGVRIVVLGVSSILGIFTTRLILDSFGKDAYAQYGLLISLAALIPFADLGISGAIMNAIGESEHPETDDKVRGVLVTSIRIATVSALVVIFISLTLTIMRVWPVLLGSGLDETQGNLAAGISFALVGVAIPFGIGQRTIAALGKNHITIALQGLRSPLVLATLFVIVWTGAQAGGLIAVVPYTVTVVIVILATLIAGKLLSPAFGQAVRAAPRIRSVRGHRVFDMALPLMIQMIALPLAMQTDRIVLSHFATIDDLAEYSLAFQVFNPVWVIVTAAGYTLWPVFAKDRTRDAASVSPFPIAIGFGTLALLLAMVLAMLSPLLTQIASGGQISLSLLTIVGFVLLMTMQGLKYPLGMYLTTPTGMWFQALMIVLMVPVNLGLSIILAQLVGAAGPVIGSVVGVFLFQVVANALYVFRQQRKGELVADRGQTE